MVIGVISAANEVPAMIAPKTMLEEDWNQSPSQSLGPGRQEIEEQKKGGSWWLNR